jgi:hypothetical protein
LFARSTCIINTVHTSKPPYLDVPAMSSSRRSYCLLISTGLLSPFSRYLLAIYYVSRYVFLSNLYWPVVFLPVMPVGYLFLRACFVLRSLLLSASLFHPYLYITLISLSLHACFLLVRSGACSSLSKSACFLLIRICLLFPYLYVTVFSLSQLACFLLVPN